MCSATGRDSRRDPDGLAAYVGMNYVVVPLSAARPGSHDPLWVGLSIAVHVARIGVPIALISARALTRS